MPELQTEQANTQKSLVDFKTWSELAQSDPDVFEARRAEIITDDSTHSGTQAAPHALPAVENRPGPRPGQQPAIRLHHAQRNDVGFTGGTRRSARNT